MLQDLILLISPPASGKTWWVSNFSKEISPERILVISPLRALADECRQNWPSELQVMTPEEWVRESKKFEVVIFDEFHLWFHWGDTFRPLLWEIFYELSLDASLVCLLTATVSDEMKNVIASFSAHFDRVICMNFGNRMLKNKPSFYVKCSSKKSMLELIKGETPGEEIRLVFCRYRSEVNELHGILKGLGFDCLTCIGGESKFMKDKLNQTPFPDFIISTTVLSHGVNLPQISKIYFMYMVNDPDFWIQMVARGGRRGECFSVFALEKPIGLKWSRIRNFWIVVWLTFKRKMSLREGLLPSSFISK
jgi:superfamily II DNA helicase RecQ